MLNKLIARSLMVVIPEKRAATIILMPDSQTPVTIQVKNAWMKPLSVTRSQYGVLNLQGDETLIKIPQHELVSGDQNHEIRARDQITIDGTTYRVLMSTLKSV